MNELVHGAFARPRQINSCPCANYRGRLCLFEFDAGSLRLAAHQQLRFWMDE